MLVWFDNVDELLSKAEAMPAATHVVQTYSGPFPLVKDAKAPDGSDGARADIELAFARIFRVEVGTDKYDSVVLCRMEDGAPKWTVYCGDGQVEGKFRNDGKTLAATLRKGGTVGTKVANRLEASEWVSTLDDAANCGFFKILERGMKKVPPEVKFCSHVKAMLHNLQKPEMEEMAAELKEWQEGKDGAVLATPTKLSPEETAFFDSGFIQHVMLAGERGSGKTVLGRMAADYFDAVYLEMQMHPSMEAWEFRAHDRAWNGKVYTVLGKLAEAVYWIQQGKKVVLCMDEFLNMNPLYTTAINTPLTLTTNDTYIIETGRIIDMGDGIGRVETVEVPADMFWVVATSNIGARYNLDKMAPSVRARFKIILMNTSPTRTQSILEKNLAKYDMPFEFAEMFKKFLEGANAAVAENNLDEEATTRLACGVIRSVYLKAKRDGKKFSTVKHWLPAVKQELMSEIAQVVNFELGPLDVDQEETYKTLVNKCFTS